MDGAGNRALVPSARVWDSGGPPPPPPPTPSDPHFPAGLRVLVVDDDITCLTILKKMLVKCQYHVMVCSEAKKALNILRERKGCFDIVLSDVHMPDMDGFKLLEQIGLEMDLPVIMMSADDGKDIVMKGVTHGACDYLIKPVSMDSLRNIWQHVVRKKRHELRELENSCSAEESDKQKRSFDDGENDSSPNNGMWNNPKKRKEEEDEVEEREETSTMKKPRVVWSVELHQQFVTAVNQLGVDKAVPKKILELMNVPGLTRENVASHLQKYRLYLRRLSVPQNQVRVETPFPGATDPAFGSIIDGFEPPSQLHPQDHMSLHSAPRRSTNTFADMSSIDHMASFNPDAQMVNSTKMRPAPGQQLNQQMDMLYGPSMCVDPRQFVQSHQMIQFYGNMGVQVSEGMLGFPSVPSSLRANSLSPGTTPSGLVSNSLVIPRTEQGQHFSLSQQQNQMQNGMLRHPPLRGPPINGNVGELTSRISSTRQHNMHNGISSHVPGRGKYTADGDILLVGTYMNTSCIPSALPASSYSIMNSSVASILPSSDMTQESASTNMKGLKDFTPHYDLYNEARYDPAQQLGAKQRNIDFGSSFSTQQDFSSSLKDGGSRSTCTVRKEIFSIRAEIEREKVQCVSQQNGTFLMENSIRLKTESLPDTSGRDILYADNDFADDIIGVIGRQQQGTGQVEDYPFNVYTTR